MCFYSVQTAFSRLVTSSDTPLLLSANRQPRPAYRVLVRPLALVWTRHRQPSTSTDRATGPISKRGTPHLLTASYIYFLLYCRLLSTPTQVPIATGKQYRVLVRPLDKHGKPACPRRRRPLGGPPPAATSWNAADKKGSPLYETDRGRRAARVPPPSRTATPAPPAPEPNHVARPYPSLPPPPPGRGGRYPAQDSYR